MKINKLIKNISLVSSAIALPLLSMSCSILGEEDKNISQTKMPFKHYGKEYEVENQQISVYYKNGSDLPYVDVIEMIDKLDGFLKSNMIYTHKNFFTRKLELFNNGTVMKIGHKKDEIYVNDLSFFNFVNEPTVTNYAKNINLEAYNIQNYSKRKGVEFDLDDYDLDILYFENKILLPLAVFNTMFCSPNFYSLYCNGKEVIGCEWYINEKNSSLYSLFANSLYANKTPTKEYRKDVFNHMCFSFDYYYGLKKYKEINESFEDYFKEKRKDIYNNILSESVSDNNKGYTDFIYRDLDELHSWVNNLSFYNPESFRFNTPSNDSMRYSIVSEKYYDTHDTLEAYYKNATGSNDKQSLRTYKDMAVIKFDQFIVGPGKNLNSQNDTYTFISESLKQLDPNKYNNIVIDLSLNGGGSVAAMIKTIGFMTDKLVPVKDYDTLSNVASSLYYSVNIPEHAKPFRNKSWSILTSFDTFSAANQLSAIVKEQQIAKIVGKKSSGGMCAIMPIVLVDGTTFIISSTNAAYVTKKPILYGQKSVQNGVPVDVNLEYKDFYNLDALYKAIK